MVLGSILSLRGWCGVCGVGGGCYYLLLTGYVAFTVGEGGRCRMLKGTVVQWFEPGRWMSWDAVMWALADGWVRKERPRGRGGGGGR